MWDEVRRGEKKDRPITRARRRASCEMQAIEGWDWRLARRHGYAAGRIGRAAIDPKGCSGDEGSRLAQQKAIAAATDRALITWTLAGSGRTPRRITVQDADWLADI